MRFDAGRLQLAVKELEKEVIMERGIGFVAAGACFCPSRGKVRMMTLDEAVYPTLADVHLKYFRCRFAIIFLIA